MKRLYWFNDFINNVAGITDRNAGIVFTILVVLCLLTAVLRLVVCSVYTGQRALFRLNAKEIKKKEHIKNIKFPFLVKLIKDYQKIGDTGVAVIDSQSIVTRHLKNLSLFGWSYVSMEDFIRGVEQAVPVFGLLFALVFEGADRFIFGVFCFGAFILFKILASLFHFGLIREKYTYDLQEYLDREIGGRFYAGDYVTAVQRLKTELSAAIEQQSIHMDKSIEQLTEGLSAALNLSFQEMSKAFDKSLERFSSFSAALDEPMAKWKETIEHAFDAQDQINAAAYGMSEAVDRFNKTASGLETSFQSYAAGISAQFGAMEKMVSAFSEAASGISKQYNQVASLNETVGSQLSYLAQNQELLDDTVRFYEESLKNLTGSLSDGFGSIINFHMEQAYEGLNQELQGNIKQIISSNSEVIDRFEKLFSQLSEQSRNELQALIKLKEQMEIYYSNRTL